MKPSLLGGVLVAGCLLSAGSAYYSGTVFTQALKAYVDQQPQLKMATNQQGWFSSKIELIVEQDGKKLVFIADNQFWPGFVTGDIALTTRGSLAGSKMALNQFGVDFDELQGGRFFAAFWKDAFELEYQVDAFEAGDAAKFEGAKVLSEITSDGGYRTWFDIAGISVSAPDGQQFLLDGLKVEQSRWIRADGQQDDYSMVELHSLLVVDARTKSQLEGFSVISAAVTENNHMTFHSRIGVDNAHIKTATMAADVRPSNVAFYIDGIKVDEVEGLAEVDVDSLDALIPAVVQLASNPYSLNLEALSLDVSVENPALGDQPVVTKLVAEGDLNASQLKEIASLSEVLTPTRLSGGLSVSLNDSVLESSLGDAVLQLVDQGYLSYQGTKLKTKINFDKGELTLNDLAWVE